MEGYAKDRAAQTAKDRVAQTAQYAAAEAVRRDVAMVQAQQEAAEAVRRDAAMVQAQQEIAAAATAAATREAERAQMLEASDRQRIAAASRLFARRANGVRRTLADSLALSATRYAAFSDSTSVILSDLFVADPSASSARIADELRVTFDLFQRQRKEFEKQVSDVVAKAMRGKKPFATALDVEEVVSSIGALEDRPTEKRGALIKAAIEWKLEARRSNEESCRTVALACDATRLDTAALRTYTAAVVKRRRETARQRPQLRARLDGLLDSLNASADERADAHSHYSQLGYEYIATARLYVSNQRNMRDEAKQQELRRLATEQQQRDEAKQQELRRLATEQQQKDEAKQQELRRLATEQQQKDKARQEFDRGARLEYAGTAGTMQQAASFYDRACAFGDPRGCVNLGAMFEAGRGVAKNRSEAEQAYERGCLLQDSNACGMLLRIRK